MKPIVFILLFFFTCCFGSVAFAQDTQNNKRQPAVVEEIVVPEMRVVNNRLVLNNAPVGRQVEIFTILGNKVRQIEIKYPDGEHELNLPRAIYIFKLDGAVKKFIIR